MHSNSESVNIKASGLEIKTNQDLETEVALLKEKVADLERQIDLQPLNDKIKELDKKLNETG